MNFSSFTIQFFNIHFFGIQLFGNKINSTFLLSVHIEKIFKEQKDAKQKWRTSDLEETSLENVRP